MKKLRVLVACECSGRVREAFRKLGHDAWSADIQPADDGSEFHLQGEVLEVLDQGWDLLIGHPPCTYLCNSGVCHLQTEYGRWVKLYHAAAFFKKLWRAPIECIALENPIMHGYGKRLIGEDHSQLVHPYQFGDPMTKGTCLWLKNLPFLMSTNWVEPKFMTKPDGTWYRGKKGGRCSALHWISRSNPNRSKLRSVTFQGIADAMASQWGGVST